MSTSPPSSSSKDKAAATSDARSDRLRKVNEEVLRKKMQSEAKETCAEHFQAFGACAQKNGLAVIFNCRKENQAMSDCMDKHCSEQHFEEYLRVRGIERPPYVPWYQKYIS
jgi:hypothetical protein